MLSLYFLLAAASLCQSAPVAATTYDFVIVGSGAGGGPLAARLAMADFSVLLIDAGDDQSNATVQQLPALQLQSTEYGPMRWDYYVNHYSDGARQAQDTKMTWRKPDGSLHVGIAGPPPVGSTPLGILYPRAGTLGGCATHNALITVYPHESDWKGIQTLTGDDSWAPDNMRNYFQRVENYHYAPTPPASPQGHGFFGWLGTERTDLRLFLADRKLQWLILVAAKVLGQTSRPAWFNSVVQLFQVFAGDMNAQSATRDSTQGLFQVPIASRYGQRNGPVDLLRRVQAIKKNDGTPRYKLDIKLQTLVTRVRFDNSTSRPRAVGVDFLTGPSLYRADPRASSADGIPGSVDAKLEVILAAGAFNTPQLLKLSGIGPQQELEQFQIPLVKNLPAVGTNLQDRYETGLVGQADSAFDITKDCKFLANGDAPGQDPCLDKWRSDPRGDRGTYANNGPSFGIVKKSSVAEGDPDLFIAGAPASFRGYYPGYSDNAIKGRDKFTWIVLKAHSRNNAGKVTLRSADPRDTPIINFNNFDSGVTTNGASDKDLKATVEGMKLARQLFPKAGSMGLVGEPSFTEIWPGNKVNTDSEWNDFVKQEAWGHHASCTCPIGPTGDETNSVVDSKFSVQGVDGLRIVDASVFPKIPGFYLVLPTYMISEKAAEVIIAKNNGRSYQSQGMSAQFPSLAAGGS